MRRPLFAVCVLMVAIVALQLWQYDPIKRNGVNQSLLEGMCGKPIVLTGNVCQREQGKFVLDVSSKSNRFYSSKSKTAVSQDFNEIKEKVNMNGRWICEYPMVDERIKIGNQLTIQGELFAFRVATNPGEFDMAQYNQMIGIQGNLRDVEIISCHQKKISVREDLYQLKCKFQNRLYKVFPEKEASILTAMLLGDKSELDEGIRDLYKNNGMIHILSISGLHITMIGMGVYRFLRKLGFSIGIAALIGTTLLVVYGIMTGMGVSTSRAIGMYLIRMLGEVMGRTYDMLTALGVMAICLACINPLYLMHAGFLLSFGSVLGVAIFLPSLLEIFSFFQGGKWRQALLAGISITLFTLPIQLWFFYEVPTYSILLNFIILPFVGVVMASGMFAMLVPGSGVIGTLACLVLTGYEWVCKMFQLLPFHTWNPGKPSIYQVIFYYSIMLFICAIRTKKWRGKSIFAFLCLLLGIVLFELSLSKSTKIAFLDVGQGDCIVIETKEREVYVFDCGSSNKKKVGERILIPYLKYRGIQEVTGLFMSHPDQDHMSGIQELLVLEDTYGIDVKGIVLPDIISEKKEEDFAKIYDMLQENDERIYYVQEGERFESDGVSFLCVHPPGGYDSEDTNSYSECFYIMLEEGISLLLTGDVEGEGEKILMDNLQDYDVNHISILKVAHHGSSHSTCQEFLSMLRPTISIISCGRHNAYGHPHEELIERLEKSGTKIYQTSQNGAILLNIRDTTMELWTYILDSV